MKTRIFEFFGINMFLFGAIFLVNNCLCLSSCVAIAQEDLFIDEPIGINAAAQQNKSPLYQERGRGRPRGAYKMQIQPHWFGNNEQFWYLNDLPRGKHEFIRVDAKNATRDFAFDHQRLAKALNEKTEKEYSGDQLPFREIQFDTERNSIQFKIDDQSWSCNLETYQIEKVENPAQGAREERPGERNRNRNRDRTGRGRRTDRSGKSPGGKWSVAIRENNVHLREGDDGEWIALTDDGTESRAYAYPQWSPDSSAIVAYRVRPGDEFEVHLLESSPEEGGRAKLTSRRYPLPGDRFTEFELNLFDVQTKKEIPLDVDVVDFGFPRIRWQEDRGHFTYEKVDRGHQRFRLIDINQKTGETKNIIDEKSDTFIWTVHYGNIQMRPVNWLEKTEEIIYYSERDGWRHLYLVDSVNGGIKNQITTGEYVVRGIDRIDEENRQIWFTASGKNTDQDPYLVHYYRINFDGTGLVALTDGNGNHSAQYSPDQKYFIDSFSRVDMAPVHQLRRTSDGQLVCELEVADISGLSRAGFRAPEVFSAKGRDGKTDIWGVITTPRNFDPNAKYPVIEYIYAGPQDSFVPKTFSPFNRFASLADQGYIVVQIDGMGTANRSKAFHDVCWHNLKDAGFPDRILWMKAAAQTRPFMDLERVGVYGTSAGGQNAAGAVLFHPEFYKVASANCGCHDNRMDKASWNEQWMGYPVGPHYAECSNIDNAHRLQGHLQLIVGEMDTNVPPESTYRLCDALIKADKDFEFILVPGGGHGAGQASRYHHRRMYDFFAKHLKGAEIPNRNAIADNTSNERQRSNNTDSQRPSTQQSNGDRRTDQTSIQNETEKAKKVENNARGGSDRADQQEGDKGQDEREELSQDSVGNDLKLNELKPERSAVGRIVIRYQMDRRKLQDFYEFDVTQASQERLRKFDSQWYLAVQALKKNDITKEHCAELDAFAKRLLESVDKNLFDAASQQNIVGQFAPFSPVLFQLFNDRLAVKKVDARQAAASIDAVAEQVQAAIEQLASKIKSKSDAAATNSLSEYHLSSAMQLVLRLRTQLKAWHRFYDGYDPLFSWWTKAPMEKAINAMDEYADALKSAAAEAAKENSETFETRIEQGQEGFYQFEQQRALNIVAQFQSGGDVPDLAAMIRSPTTLMELVINKYTAESRSRWRGRRGRGLQERSDRTGNAAHTPAQWLSALEQIDFDALPHSGKVDYVLFKNQLQYAAESGDQQQLRADLGTAIDESGIRGRPVGREELIRQLRREMIPYAPDQLIDIAATEYQWCQDELKKATKEMGFGDDVDAAIEHVKSMHVMPGDQPVMIRELAWEAIDYLNENQLITVPQLAAETWQMRMMSPERQLINPFFTGGTAITVSFPTDTMSHDAKIQSMRGNNIPFSRATVHHELIPGHNLQFFMNPRYNAYRNAFNTPFWLEGWALYWEMVLYDRGFPKTPEDRIGFLVWRRHRCARIVFSLSFHLGRMKPNECIDYLVEHVGFDRNNAAAEVRRSFEQAPPLYQAAYMTGGLQFRALRNELVDSGKMGEKEFHDAIMHAGIMPVEMVRATLTNQPLSRDYETSWYFYRRK